MTIHKEHPVSVDASQIGGILSLVENPGITSVRSTADGFDQPTFVSRVAHAPGFSFETLAISSALTVAGFAGARTSGDGFVCYSAKLGDGGAKASGSNHVKSTMATALVIPRSLTVSSNGNATLSMDALGYSASGGEAILRATAQALSAQTYNSEVYGLGPVSLNGAALASVQDITLDFGIALEGEYGDGYICPKDIRIVQRAPTVTLTCVDPTVSVAVTGTAITTLFQFYLRRRSDGGAYVADDGGTHILFAFNDGVIYPTGESGVTRRRTFVIEPTHDGTNASMIITTGSNIT